MASPLDLLTGAELPQQDFIVLGGMKSPGRATIVSAAFERKYDVREPYGAIGGSTIYHGEKIKSAEVLIELWEKSHFADWALFARAVLFKKPGKVAMSVDHPVLRLIQLTEVQVEKVSAFTQDEEGMWSCTITLLEFKPPMAALSKPLAAIPNAPKPNPTAQDAADLEIQRLGAQLAAVAG